MSKNELSIVSEMFESKPVRTARDSRTNDLYVCLNDLESASGLDRKTSLKFIAVFQSNYGLENFQPIIHLEVEDAAGRTQKTLFVHQTLANFLIPKGNSEKAVGFSLWLAKVATELQTKGVVDLRPSKSPMELVLESIQFLQEQVAIEKAAKEEAIRTKALISDKKTATALATASNAIKAKNKAESERDEMAIQLSQNKQWMTILAAEKRFGKKFPWHPLKRWHIESNIPIKKVHDDRYGEVSAYHIDAWKAVHGVDVY